MLHREAWGINYSVADPGGGGSVVSRAIRILRACVEARARRWGRGENTYGVFEQVFVR